MESAGANTRFLCFSARAINASATAATANRAVTATCVIRVDYPILLRPRHDAPPIHL